MQAISDVQLQNMDAHFKNITKIGLISRKLILDDHLIVNNLFKLILFYFIQYLFN